MKMKLKYFTKPVTDHLSKLGLTFNPEGVEKECRELMEHIYEEKIIVSFQNEVDAIFIKINSSEDLDKAKTFAHDGYSVTIGIPKGTTISTDETKVFEGVIVNSDDIGKFEEGHKNLYVAFDHKPSKVELDYVFDYVKQGKLQILNLETANNRRPNVKGYSPKTGALLDSYGSINITSLDVSRFIVEGTVVEEDGTEQTAFGFDSQGLLKAQVLSTRANVRELTNKKPKELKAIQARDALLGVSLRGVKATANKLNWDDNQVDGLINGLQDVAHEEAMGYSAGLRFPLPMLVTTVDEGEIETFDEYIRYQKFYVNHNALATIEVVEEELESYKQLILDNWEWFISVDFKVVF